MFHKITARSPEPQPTGSLAPAWLTIDLAAVAQNYETLKSKVGTACQVAAVIKADAYGLGMREMAAVLEERHCPLYVVATPDEAVSLRALTRKPILALGGVYPGAEDLFVHNNIIPALNSLEDIERWAEAAERHEIRLPCALHFDTGLNRLGLPAAETEQLLAERLRLDHLDIRMVMSHFACADDAAHPLNALQYERFKTIAAAFPAARKSLCNSSGLFRSTVWHGDIVRPGQALYGLNPTPETANPMKPVLRLDARLLQVKTARKGESLGYGAAHHFTADTTVGTVALGYADGFFRALGNSKSVLYYRGRPCPVIGRVSMDFVTIDLGSPAAQAGDLIEILGPHQSVEDLARAGGTINYEIITALGRRYKRIYTS